MITIILSIIIYIVAIIVIIVFIKIDKDEKKQLNIKNIDRFKNVLQDRKKYIKGEIPNKIYRLWCTREKHGCGGRDYSSEPWERTEKAMGKNYQQEIITDDDYIPFLEKHFGKGHKILKALSVLNPKYGAARADLMRYAIMYIKGGIYLDFKSCIIKKLPQMPDHIDMITTRVSRDQTHFFSEGEIINWFLYVRPKSLIMLDILTVCISNILDVHQNPYKEVYYDIAELSKLTIKNSKSIVLNITGPIMLTNVIENSKHRNSVLINSSLLSKITYMCQSNNREYKKHYSRQIEPLVKPIKNGLYIPKKIYLTCYDKKIIPKYVYKNIKKYCKGFEIKIFDDLECISFLQKYYGDTIVKLFNTLEGAYKADLFRYCILYLWGGLYFDIKTNFQKDISKIFSLTENNSFYTVLGAKLKENDGITDTKPCIYQGILVTSPRNPILLDNINYILQNHPTKYYTEYVVYFYKSLQKLCRKKLKPGNNILQNKWKCMLLNEECKVCKLNEKKCDKYNLQCKIVNEKRELMFLTRYYDYPWK